MALSRTNTERYKKLTLLHSNDLHGDFLAEQVDETLVGGVSMLDGYITKCRNEEKNCLYAVAGDMVRGSVMDSEFRGLSTMQIMNYLAPDVATIGNHETDYGLSHLLLMEKCAHFPIINANMYIKGEETRLFNSHQVIRIDGMNILFIGAVTNDVIANIMKDPLIGSMIECRDIAQEVGHICNAYNSLDIDLTVLLTHIGFEEDKRLAETLDPSWNVDIIIGGHSHTLPEEPAVVNDILIVQAGCGTDQIGRFDLTIDTMLNRLESYSWKTVPINPQTCPTSPRMEHLVHELKSRTDLKYERVVANFDAEFTHPDRYRQTDLGGLFADALKDSTTCDIVLVGSGSLRAQKLGPIVTYREFSECCPYDGKVFGAKVSGEQFRRMMKYMCRDDTWNGDHTEFYQLSRGLHVVYSRCAHELLECTFNGEEIQDDRMFTIGFQEFHYNNMLDFFGVSEEEITRNGARMTLSTSEIELLLGYFEEHTHLGNAIEARLEIVD